MRPRRPFAIRTRLTLWYGAVLATTIAGLGIVVWFSAAAVFHRSIDETLDVQAADVRSGLDRDPSVSVTTLDPGEAGIFTAIFGADGRLLQRSTGVPSGLREPADGLSTQRLSASGNSFAVVAEPAQSGQVVVVGSSLAQLDRNLDSLAQLLLAVGAAGFVASLVGGWILSGRALAPVERLTREATEIGATDLDRRLPEPARLDEIGRLARTLNGMLDRVAAAVRRERFFVSAASHDLRTPIASLRTELELAAREQDPSVMREAIRVAHGDAVRLSALAADLLGLADAEASGQAIVRRPVAVGDLVEAAASVVRPLATERSIAIRPRLTDAVVEVDRVRLEQALGNLLSNAIREGPPGSAVDIVAEVADGSEAGPGDDPPAPGPAAEPASGRETPVWRSAALDLAVLDRGAGVAPAVRRVLFVPFATRAGGRPGGTGLGLATAAAAARAHGGTIGYEDRPGGGAVFRLRIPTSVLVEPGRVGEPAGRPDLLPEA